MGKIRDFYIITDNLTLMKVNGEKMSNIIEFYLSPLNIRYGIKNSNSKELVKTLEKELKRQNEENKRM